MSTFIPAEYLSALAELQRAGEVRYGGSRLPEDASLEYHWSTVARYHAHRSIVALIEFLASGPPEIGPREDEFFASFGSFVGRIVVLSERAARKKRIDRGFSELSATEVDLLYGHLAEEFLAINYLLNGGKVTRNLMPIPLLSSKDIERLASDPRYADLGKGAIKRAVLKSPKNPNAFLDGVIANIERLMADPHYADLGKGVIKTAAVGHSTNPDSFLDGAIANIERLMAEPRYADLGKAVIKTAATSHSTNPDAFLDGVIANIERLASDPHYADLGKAAIKAAAIRNPTKPDSFLDGVIANIEQLASDPRYADLGKGVIKTAAVGYPTNPDRFLDGVITNADILNSEPSYVDHSDESIALSVASDAADSSTESIFDEGLLGQLVPPADYSEEDPIATKHRAEPSDFGR